MPDTAAPTVTLTEAPLLGEALRALRAAEARIIDLAGKSTDNYRTMRLGQVAEAISVADDVLFNVLNAASAFTGCTASWQALEDSHPGRPPAAPPTVTPVPPAYGTMIFDGFDTAEDAARFAAAVREVEPDLQTWTFDSETASDAFSVFPFLLHAPIVHVERPYSGDDNAILYAREQGFADNTPTGAEREEAICDLTPGFACTYRGT